MTGPCQCGASDCSRCHPEAFVRVGRRLVRRGDRTDAEIREAMINEGAELYEEKKERKHNDRVSLH